MYENQRCNKLRERLDRLNYCQPFHPDSAALVERLLNNLIKKTDDYQKLKAQHNSLQSSSSAIMSRTDASMTGFQYPSGMSAQQVSDYDHKIDLLNQQNFKITQQNETLKMQLKEAMSSNMNNPDLEKRCNQLRAKYDNKIAEYTRKISNYERQQEKTNSLKEELEERIDELLRDNQMIAREREKIERKLVEADEENTRLTRQLQTIRSGVTASESSKAKDLSEMLQRKTALIHEMEQNEIMFKARTASLQREVEDLTAQNKVLTAEASSLGSTNQALKAEAKELMRQIEKLKNDVNEVSRDNDYLRREKNELEKTLAQIKEQEFTSKLQTETTQYAKNRLESMHEDTLQTLKMKKEENEQLRNQVEDMKRELDRQESKIAELEKIRVISEENMNEMREEMQRTQNRLTEKLKQARELELKKSSLQRELREMKPVQNQRQPERSQVYDVNAIEVEQKIRKQVDKEIRVYQEQISLLKDSEQGLILQNEKLSGELKRMQNFISNGERQIELITSQKQALMKELHEFKDKLTASKEYDHSSKMASSVLEQKLRTAQLECQDLKTTLQAETLKSKKLQQQFSALQITLKQHEEFVQKSKEQIELLQRKIAGLEKNNSEIYGRLIQTASSKSESEEEKIIQMKQFDRLKFAVTDYEHRLAQKERALQAINDDRDQMQNLLDEQTLQNKRLREEIEGMRNAQQFYDQQVDKTHINNKLLHSKIEALDSEVEKLKKLLDRSTEELKDARNRIAKMDSAASVQNTEMNMVVLSKKEMAKELDRIQGAYYALQKKYKEKIKETSELNEEYLKLKIHSQELANELEQFRTEHVKLNETINEFNEANNDMYNQLHIKDKQIIELKQTIHMHQQNEKAYKAEICSLEREVTHLTSKLSLIEEEFNQVSLDRETLKCHINSTLKEGSLQWRHVVGQRMTLLQRELEVKKKECDDLRVKVFNLEKILADERKIQMQLADSARHFYHNDTQNTPIRAISMSHSNSRFQEVSIEGGVGGDFGDHRSEQQEMNENNNSHNLNRSHSLQEENFGGGSSSVDKIHESYLRTIELSKRFYNKK